MDVQRYIDSGILEAFVTGGATPAEEREVLFFKDQYAEVREALQLLEVDMEHMAKTMAIPPPPGTWTRIEAEINALIEQDVQMRRYIEDGQNRNSTPPPGYIDVESESSHMRLHKSWRWIFAAVFILGKIFLAFAIFFYLENRQAQQQIRELKKEIQLQKP